MKRTRRVSVEIEHREIFLSITSTTGSSPLRRDAEPGQGVTTPIKPDAPLPDLCPSCGAPWIALLAKEPVQASEVADQIRAALEQSQFHFHFTAGQLWVCSRSFHAMKENF